MAGGMYGTGRVEIWNRGKYELVKREPSKIEFVLKGKKLKGHYALIRFKDNWLFFKLRR